MGNLKFRILYLGKAEHEKYKLVKTDDLNERIESPRTAVLIDHPDMGYILYDTGDADDWDTVNSSEVNELYPTTEHISLQDKLLECGLDASQIDRVILSHLHFDHVGGLRHFAGTKAANGVVVSEPEAREVFFKTIADQKTLGHAYTPSLYAGIEGVVFRPIDGLVNFARDVTLFVQRCHTQGVIGMIVRLGDGESVLFTGDTLYTREAFEKSMPPGGALHVTDDEFLKNREIIRQMEHDFRAELFFGHDYAQTRAWEQKGWIESADQIRE